MSNQQVKNNLFLEFLLHLGRCTLPMIFAPCQLNFLWHPFWRTRVDHDLPRHRVCIYSSWKIKSQLFSGLAVQRTRARSQGFQSEQPHIAVPHHCLFIPLHPTWQTERARETHRTAETERGTWQWIQALLGSVEQLCLIKCLASKKKGGKMEYFTTIQR